MEQSNRSLEGRMDDLEEKVARLEAIGRHNRRLGPIRRTWDEAIEYVNSDWEAQHLVDVRAEQVAKKLAKEEVEVDGSNKMERQETRPSVSCVQNLD
jgi:hypothetical protein